MGPIRALIVDDEELARLRIEKLLAREPDVEVAGHCTDGTEALKAIAAEQPDLVFLDIQMQRLSGLDVVKRLPADHTPIFVFITAYDQYAVRAFETSALDYLLKPFTDERFYTALQRARDRIEARQIKSYSDQLLSLLQHHQAPAAPPPTSDEAPATRRLVLKMGSRLLFLDAEDIDWVEAQGVYVQVHVGSQAHLLRESLTNVEKRLDSRQFVRIHRSTLVNMDRIKEIVPHLNGGSVVILHDGKRLKMSRSYRDKVSATLG